MSPGRLSARCLCYLLVIALLLQGCAMPAPVGSELPAESASLSQLLPTDNHAVLVFGGLNFSSNGVVQFPVPEREPIDPATQVAMAGLCTLLIVMMIATTVALGGPVVDPGCIPTLSPPEPPNVSIVAWEVESERWARIWVQADGSFAVRLPQGRYAVLDAEGLSGAALWLEYLFEIKPGDRTRYLGTLVLDKQQSLFKVETSLEVRDDLPALLASAGKAEEQLKTALADPAPAAWAPILVHTSYGFLRAKGTDETPHEVTWWKFPAPDIRPSRGYRRVLLEAFDSR